MKKFQFRLEQVLQQKMMLEEQALLEQAKAQQECVRYEMELNSSREKLSQTLEHAETVKNPSEQMQSLIYLEYLKQTIDKQRRHLQRAQEILQIRKNSVLKARQERLVLEKLKEKQMREYQDLQMHLAQKEIDELATLGFCRLKN